MNKVVICLCAAAMIGLSACSEEGAIVYLTDNFSEGEGVNKPDGGEDKPGGGEDKPGGGEDKPGGGEDETCTDACEGEDVCDGETAYKTCKDDDGDGCKEWVTVPCDADTKCENGSCHATSETCTDACEGANVCDGENAFKTCKDNDGDGCKEWVTIPCDASTKCNDGNCSPACTDVCEGDPVCEGETAYKTCADSDGDGCKEWLITNCDDHQKCENGHCTTVCTNACENGKKQCNGKAVQTCADYNGDGCVEWGGDSPCGYQCSEGACVNDPNAWVPPCTTEADMCPEPITDFSQKITGTTKGRKNIFDEYPTCHTFNKSSVPNESGPEKYYVVNITEPGTLIVGLKSKNGDVDVHLLTDLAADKCIARADESIGQHVEKGIYYIVADSYNGSGNAGDYEMKVTFIPDSGPCGMVHEDMARYGNCSTISMPVTASTAAEAHLVTDYDRKCYGSSWWPSSTKSDLDKHKAHTNALYGSGTAWGNDWCPAEGGNVGQGSAANQVPADAEAWYINMKWKKRPAMGTRFLVVNPLTGDTIVAAGGYETGPWECNNMGGAVYEIHHYLGTGHGSVLTFGKLKDSAQDYAYGPVDCNGGAIKKREYSAPSSCN